MEERGSRSKDGKLSGGQRATRAAFWIAGGYMAVGLAWITLSDWGLEHAYKLTEENAAMINRLQMLKDCGFIVVTGVLLGLLVRFYIRSIQGMQTRLQSESERAAENYQKIFDRNPLPMWVYDTETLLIMSANTVALQKYGYSLEEFRGMKVTDLAVAEDLSRAMQVIGQVGGGPRLTIGWTHHHKDGTRFEVEVISDSMEYDGKAARVVVAKDVTERVRAERAFAENQQMLEERVAARTEELSAANEKLLQQIEVRRGIEGELRKAKQEAEEASEAKSGFIANTSHEIRTPLTSILGYADLLADPELPESSREKYVSVLQQNASHLLKLIDDLLDLSRMEMGKMSVAFDQNSPRDLAHQAVDLLQPRAAEKSLVLTLDFGVNVPAMIRTDGTRVVQVLINLLTNAIKFTPAGWVLLRVRGANADCGELGPDEQANWVCFEVIDSGIGMEKEATQRIFEPFFQVEHGSNRRYGGAGLGLAISKELVALLGGTMHVTSEVGKGSVFSVSLPVEMRKEEEVPAVAALKREAQLHGHILLADDNAVVRWLVEEYLRRAGAVVTGVGDGEAAVAAVRDALAGTGAIDLVLMDINMPGMDGLQAMKKIREMGFKGPVAALTAHSTSMQSQDWMNAGWDAMASKPIDRNNFIPLVARLMEEGRERKSE